MKISVNDVELFTLTETQKKVIKNDILSEIFEDDMKRRLQYIIMEKYNQCMKRLREDWTARFKEKKFPQIPVDDEEFAQLVFAQPDYKNRSQREAENSK